MPDIFLWLGKENTMLIIASRSLRNARTIIGTLLVCFSAAATSSSSPLTFLMLYCIRTAFITSFSGYWLTSYYNYRVSQKVLANIPKLSWVIFVETLSMPTLLQNFIRNKCASQCRRKQTYLFFPYLFFTVLPLQFIFNRVFVTVTHICQA